MTLYLTDKLDPEEVQQADDEQCVHAIKFYPAGATTNSESGVAELECVYPAIEKMAELGLPLLIHGEVTDCLLYTSPSPRDRTRSRMPSSA